MTVKSLEVIDKLTYTEIILSKAIINGDYATSRIAKANVTFERLFEKV